MSLRDLSLKKAYSSDSDDILHDFYIPALGAAVEYRRIAGFFSSSSLAIAAKGIVGLLKNDGVMKLIVSPKFRKRDLEVLVKSHKEPEAFIEEIMLEEINELEDRFIRDHVQVLGWMVANKRLKIQVAIMHDQNGNLVSSEDGPQGGLFHQKIGILKDSKGNTISFSGSINETARGWLDNIEEFKVFRSWEPSQQEYIEADISKFNRFWSNQSERVTITAIPDAVERKLIELAPDDISKIDLEKWYGKPLVRNTKRIELYQHQKDAIECWVKNEMRGIFEMATGTGKTFAALGCVERAIRKYERLVVIITCPYQHLVRQWEREAINFGIAFPTLIADSSNPEWKNKLADSLIDISIGYKNNLMVLTTHRTFSSATLQYIVRQNSSGLSILLIADEVHGVGAEKTKKGLGEQYDLRLGLSATPKRWFDSAGTEAIYDYFGDTVFEFGLREATSTINPTTGNTFLAPYRYIPTFVSLSAEEVQEYLETTNTIVKMFHSSKHEDEKDVILDSLIFKRANITKNAREKYGVLEELIGKMGLDIRWTIIYCTAQQIDNVMNILDHAGVIQKHRFTMEEGTKVEKKYSGLSERDHILKKFAEGEYRVLVAMKCLDEGVDVPPARTAILMASSGNPREYIQRIGRVIRQYPGKEEAVIHDMVVIPDFTNLPKEIRDIEKKIFEKELRRCKEIAQIAINNAEAMGALFSVESLTKEM